MLKRILMGGIILITGLFFMVGAVYSAENLTFHVSPELVAIGIRFDGATLHISGTIPSDCEAIVRIIGHNQNLSLKKKGKAMGLLWMNLGKIEINGVPDIMLIYPSQALYKLSENDNNTWEKLGIGFKSLEDKADVLPKTEDKSKIFKEFIKLKASLDLYEKKPDNLTYGDVSGAVKSFKVAVELPSNVPHDGFNAELYAVKDGKIIAEAVKKIKVKEIGIPAQISSLAFNHGTLYGVIAVVIAILAGIIVGVVFKESGGAH